MTVLPFLLPSYSEATTLSGLLAMTTSLLVTLKMRKYIIFKHLVHILLMFLIVSTISIFILSSIEDHILRRILGVVLIITSIYFAFFNNKIHLKTNIPTQIGAGTLSGLMGGFFAMQGPPAVLYFLSSEKDKEHYMAIVQCYFLIGNTIMTFVRAKNGFLTSTVGTNYLYGLGGVLIGSSIGGFVFKKIPAGKFRYIVYSYIGVSGIFILAIS
jgi:uncharacterized membrane protein YfcA